MSMPDLNLLITLDVLLTEGSVARAAERLQLSPSAMSRALARLRETTGDPLLVRAGRGLVPTPRALALREQVGRLVLEAEALLRPAQILDLDQLIRTFTLRTREGFVENFGAALIARLQQDAPGVRLHFMAKPDKHSAPLREGSVDLEIGVVDKHYSPELLTQRLFRDRFIGVVRAGHPLSRGIITAQRFAACQHIAVMQNQRGYSPIEAALNELGFERDISTLVAGFSAAVALARATDLIASVPEHHTGNLRAGLHSFPLPFPVPDLTVAMLWHPRQDADPAHRWLRSCVREVCGTP